MGPLDPDGCARLDGGPRSALSMLACGARRALTRQCGLRHAGVRRRALTWAVNMSRAAWIFERLLPFAEHARAREHSAP